MKLEQMKKIVDGAHKLATHVEAVTETNLVKVGADYQCIELGYPTFFHQRGRVYSLSDLRAEIAKHDTLDLKPSDIPHGCVVMEK